MQDQKISNGMKTEVICSIKQKNRQLIDLIYTPHRFGIKMMLAFLLSKSNIYYRLGN